MVHEVHVYRVFPAEVLSNTFDFDVREVVHNGQKMRGVFARRSINASECSVYIGLYPGHRMKKEDSLRKAESYAVRHAANPQMAIHNITAYKFSSQQRDPGYVLDPTDDDGNLAEEFIPYIAGYINEPPPDHKAKSAYVYNLPRRRYEAWLLQAVERDEEIFVYYGEKYFRDYPINPDARSQPAANLIPAESIFTLDPRGIPQLLQVPEIV